MTKETKYYVRAYATNEAGTAYGNVLEFTTTAGFACGDEIYDVEENAYKTVQIGKQCWMAENLRVKSKPDGTKLNTWKYQQVGTYGEVLPEHTGPTGIGPEIFYSWCTAANRTSAYTNEEEPIQGICPDGWHLPTRPEFKQLAQFVDPDFPDAQFTSTTPVSENQLAIKLANKNAHWDAYKSSGNSATGVGDPVAEVTSGYRVNSIGYAYHNNPDDPSWKWNESGFDAKPAGYLDRQSVDAPHAWVTNGTLNLWTSYGQSGNGGRAWVVKIACYNSGINQVNSASAESYTGYSVRCVKDADPTEPEVKTNPAGTVTASTAVINGEVTFNGRAAITEKGFYYSTDKDVVVRFYEYGTKIDEKEDSADRYEKPTTEKRGMLRLTFGLGRMIALDVILVNAIVLQVNEDAIDQAYPERGMAQICEGEGTERELGAPEFIQSTESDSESLHRPLGHRKEQHAKANQCSTNENEALNGLGPNHRLHASQHRIDDDGC